MKNRNVQMVCSFGMIASPSDDPALSKMTRECIRREASLVGVKICAKPLNVCQPFSAMLGYCMKDEGKAHFSTMAHNITAEEVRQGKAEYASGVVPR